MTAGFAALGSDQLINLIYLNNIVDSFAKGRVRRKTDGVFDVYAVEDCRVPRLTQWRTGIFIVAR